MTLEEIMDMPLEQQIWIKEELKEMSQDRANSVIIIGENAELKTVLKTYGEDYAKLAQSMTNTVSTAMEEMKTTNEDQNRIIREEIAQLKTSNKILESKLDEKIAANNDQMTALCKAHGDEFKLTAARIEGTTAGYINKAKDDMKEAHRLNQRYWKVQAFKNIGMWIYLALSPALIILEMLARNLGWF